MRASELIRLLQNQIAEYGDCVVGSGLTRCGGLEGVEDVVALQANPVNENGEAEGDPEHVFDLVLSESVSHIFDTHI